MTEAPIEPKRTAIVAVDFEPDVMGADGPFAFLFHAEVERTNLIPRTTGLLDRARAAGAKIVYSTAAFRPGYTDLVANFPLFTTIEASGDLIDGTPGTDILHAVAPQPGDIVLTHHRVNCFHGTELDVVLRGADIDTVVLVGVATNLAVESTARSAADLGYRVMVLADCCSTISAEVHDASLATLAMFAEIVPAEGLLARLRTASGQLTAS